MVLAVAQALTVNFSVTKGTDPEAALQLQDKIVRSVSEALRLGAPLKFDA